MWRFVPLTLLFACGTADAAWPAYRPGSPAIDARSAKCCGDHVKTDLPKLSTVALAAGEIEVRFWIVPSFANARGVVLRTSGSERRALVVDSQGTRAASLSRATWEKVTSEGILTLPDESSLASDGQYVLDGVSYAVEVQRDGVYRAYSYGNPAEHEWPEATHVLAIAHALARELHVRIDDRSAKVRARVPDVDIDASSHAIGAPCDPLDMTQPFCGPRGRVSMARERDAHSPCDPRPLPSPNPYEWGACVQGDRVYLVAKRAVLVGDLGEMSDDQRLHMQRKIGISHVTPLRTASEWRAAITASPPDR